MQTTMKLLLIAVLATLGQARAAALELLPAQSGDLSAAAAVAPTRANVRAAAIAMDNANPANASEAVAPVSLTGAFPKVTRDAVALSWATPDAATVAATPFVAQSKESYVSVTADELGAGVPLHTTSPRALVRVQALSELGPREQAAIHPLSMTVVDRGGRELSAGDGMEMIVSADKLAKAEVPFAAGTSAFRLDASLGVGDFKLKVDGASGGARYLVNVVEPDSPYTLTMQTAALHYLHGNELVLQSSLLQGDGASGARVRLTSLTGYVVSPAGRRFPVSFKPAAGGAMRATLTLDADETPVPGLWEVRAEASAQLKDQLVTRSVRLAFPVPAEAPHVKRPPNAADSRS